jgi:hypothetical protein
MTFDDDVALLDELGAALATAPASPSADEVRALRALVARDGVVVPLLPPEHTRHPLRHVLAAAVVVVLLLVATGAILLSTGSGTDNPSPPLHAPGVPADSAALTAAHAAMADLRVALEQPDDAQVVRARGLLVERLSRLDDPDLARVARPARELLERADARLAALDVADPATASSPSDPNTSPSSGAPSAGGHGSATEDAGAGDATLPPSAERPAEGPAPTTTTEPADGVPEPGDDGL